MMPSIAIKSVMAEVERSQKEAERQLDRAENTELVSYAAGKLMAHTYVLALLRLAYAEVIAYESTHNIVLFPEDKV